MSKKAAFNLYFGETGRKDKKMTAVSGYPCIMDDRSKPGKAHPTLVTQ